MALGRRMIANDVIMEPEFLKGGSGAQALYLYLALAADSLGIAPVPGVLKTLGKDGENDKDFRYLVDNGYLVTVPGFEYVAIAHWFHMNTFKNDRDYTTTHISFFKMIIRDPYNGLYRVRTQNDPQFDPEKDMPKAKSKTKAEKRPIHRRNVRSEYEK